MSDMHPNSILTPEAKRLILELKDNGYNSTQIKDELARRFKIKVGASTIRMYLLKERASK